MICLLPPVLTCVPLPSHIKALLILHSRSRWCSGGFSPHFALKETIKVHFIKCLPLGSALGFFLQGLSHQWEAWEREHQHSDIFKKKNGPAWKKLGSAASSRPCNLMQDKHLHFGFLGVFLSPLLSNWAISFGLWMATFFFWRLLPWRPRRMGRRSASCYLLHLAAGPGVMKLEVEQGTPQGIPLQASLLTHWELVCFAWMLSLFYICYLKSFPIFLLIITPFRCAT